MWSDDVINSEAAQEVEFVRLYTQYISEMRAQLVHAGLQDQVACEVATGKRCISRAALASKKDFDVNHFMKKKRLCAEMLQQRIDKRVHEFERGWLAKCVNRMSDKVRVGKENGDYKGRCATLE